MIDPARDTQLWSDRYDRELTDVFAVQGEVATHIVDALELEPGNYDSLYLYGRPRFAEGELRD